MIIAGGQASRNLARRIADASNFEIATLDVRRFPDGELYVRFTSDLKGESLAVIQSCPPPQDANLLELCLLLDTARDLGVDVLVAVVPYLAYARQDKRFLDWEAVSAKTIMRLIEATGAERLITFDVHSPDVLKFSKLKTDNLSAVSAIAEYLSRKGLVRPYVVAPDDGAHPLAKRAAEKLGGDLDYFGKARDRVTGEVKTEQKSLDVQNRDVIVIDDMISTGTSVANVVSSLRKQGARRIYAACTHGLFLGDAVERLREAGVNEIITTDCVDSSMSVVSVAPLLVEVLRNIR